MKKLSKEEVNVQVFFQRNLFPALLSAAYPGIQDDNLLSLAESVLCQSGCDEVDALALLSMAPDLQTALNWWECGSRDRWPPLQPSLQHHTAVIIVPSSFRVSTVYMLVVIL